MKTLSQGLILRLALAGALILAILAFALKWAYPGYSSLGVLFETFLPWFLLLLALALDGLHDLLLIRRDDFWFRYKCFFDIFFPAALLLYLGIQRLFPSALYPAISIFIPFFAMRLLAAFKVSPGS